MNFLIKELNELNIFQFVYYWTACGNSIYLPICEKYGLIAGLVPTTSISSSSTGDFFHVEYSFCKIIIYH